MHWVCRSVQDITPFVPKVSFVTLLYITNHLLCNLSFRLLSLHLQAAFVWKASLLVIFIIFTIIWVCRYLWVLVSNIPTPMQCILQSRSKRPFTHESCRFYPTSGWRLDQLNPTIKHTLLMKESPAWASLDGANWLRSLAACWRMICPE